jgi:hypothetical protein
MHRILLCLLPLLAAGPAPADSGPWPPNGTLRYAVIKDGERIGTQTVDFRREGERLTVETRVDALVSLLGVPVFRFHHEAEERWIDGRLAAFQSETDDDGEARRVEARLEGDGLAVLYNGRPRAAPAGILPGSLWHPGTVEATSLFDPFRGKVWNIHVADRGVETVTARGAAVSAHRYDISGDVIRQVWYGPDGRIARARFPTKDGAWVTLELE